MGLVDQILKMHGQKGLYTSTLFRVVDGLLLVDLRETDPKILNRFIGAKNLPPVLSRNLPEDYKADTSN